MRYYAVVNDLIGGYDVSPHNKPVSEHSFDRGERTLGTFMSKQDAEMVARALNHSSRDALQEEPE